MKKFLLKGILRDKSRSLVPIVVVSLGVFLTIIIYCWLNGIIGESIVMNANFNTGHIKVITKEQAKYPDQMAIDLALTNVSSLSNELSKEFPEITWVERIRFGSLIDFPDSNGITRAQGPVIGWAIDLFSKNSKEIDRFNLIPSIIRGKIPKEKNEALLSEDFAKKFDVKPGDKFTIFGTTMDGGMAFKNFVVSGTVKFGASVIDRGAIIIDINDAQDAFQMNDAVSEILGFQKNQIYDDQKAEAIKSKFNKFHINDDKFGPTIITLKEQPGMGQFLVYVDYIGSLMVIIFMSAMSIVLWNSGLLGGLRRYTEFGVRLALGENKTHIYNSLIYEAFTIGLIGSIVGTLFGLIVAFYVQKVGINIGGMMQGSTLMIPTVVRTVVKPTAYYIGFIPGVISMVIGNLLAGIGIYKRSTARLFNELEV